jgi:cytochrome b involved in lipid metabolism
VTRRQNSSLNSFQKIFPKFSLLSSFSTPDPSSSSNTRSTPSLRLSSHLLFSRSSTSSPFLFYGTLAFLFTSSISSSSSSSANKEETSTSSHSLPVYRQSDIDTHNQQYPSHLWVTYKDSVYDLTSFPSSHPGGPDKIYSALGQNLADFWLQPEFRHHLRSPLVQQLLEEKKIGELHPLDWNCEQMKEIKCATSLVVDAKTSQNLLYPDTSKVYDCIVIGAGLSGLKTAHTLINTHHLPTDSVLVLDAQDYVGGRVKQLNEFIPGTSIDVGAEFLHGDGTELTKFAAETKQKLRKIFCWAHGDGGPLSAPVNNGYGLYFLRDETGEQISSCSLS